MPFCWRVCSNPLGPWGWKIRLMVDPESPFKWNKQQGRRILRYKQFENETNAQCKPFQRDFLQRDFTGTLYFHWQFYFSVGENSLLKKSFNHGVSIQEGDWSGKKHNITAIVNVLSLCTCAFFFFFTKSINKPHNVSQTWWVVGGWRCTASQPAEIPVTQPIEKVQQRSETDSWWTYSASSETVDLDSNPVLPLLLCQDLSPGRKGWDGCC